MPSPRSAAATAPNASPGRRLRCFKRPSSAPGLPQTQRRAPPPPQRQVTVPPVPPPDPALPRQERGRFLGWRGGRDAGGKKPAAPRRLRPLPAAAEGAAGARPRPGGGGSSRPHYGGPAASAPRRRWEGQGGRAAIPPGTAPPAAATSRERSVGALGAARCLTEPGPLGSPRDPSDTPWSLTHPRSVHTQPRTSHAHAQIPSDTPGPPMHTPRSPQTPPDLPCTPPDPLRHRLNVHTRPHLSCTPPEPSRIPDLSYTRLEPFGSLCSPTHARIPSVPSAVPYTHRRSLNTHPQISSEPP
ncbi:nascent polypeptide-associated complex subunit alpha, muscle-specific form-like [Haemorhous mexicanus]|uniref:nascent polypeptide-associated complex subunit alpha, muscle-specific form-like n=1 Tax=Haemorhous mexicanus TaxID=30427 RepID=UPI0028BF54F8|nr:nascent polypeptide-associated complex subunit alpha, muscle-specific form-like [Haemorhous mexicanus]